MPAGCREQCKRGAAGSEQGETYKRLAQMARCSEPSGIVRPSRCWGLRWGESIGGSWPLARSSWRSRMRCSSSGLRRWEV